MPRHLRLFAPGATYHVYCRVARGEFVFNDPLEAEEFVLAVREVRDLHGWRIFAWALMAAARYGIRSTEIAHSVRKHPTTIARWISFGRRKQVEDQSFRERIDTLNRRISQSARDDPIKVPGTESAIV